MGWAGYVGVEGVSAGEDPQVVSGVSRGLFSVCRGDLEEELVVEEANSLFVRGILLLKFGERGFVFAKGKGEREGKRGGESGANPLFSITR